MFRFGIILIACGTYLVLCGVNLAINRPRIEGDLTARTLTALVHENLPIQEIHFAGRDATITVRGSADDVLSRTNKTALQIWGVRVAKIMSLPERAPALTAENHVGKVTITAEFPQGDARAKLMTAAGVLFGAPNVLGKFNEASDVSYPPYLTRLPSTLTLLLAVGDGGTLELKNRELILSGTVADEITRATIDGTAKEMVPAELKFINRVTVLAPRQTAAAPTATPTPISTPQVHTDVVIPKEAIPAPKVKRTTSSLRERNLNFYFDSVNLVPDSMPKVSVLVEILKQNPGKKILIVGYADATGTKRYNLGLSRRRAKAVLQVLIENGMSAKTFVTDGRGATDFIGDNSTAEGQALNRRVEFRVIGTLAG